MSANGPETGLDPVLRECPHAVLVAGADGRVAGMNPAAERMLGVREPAARGTPVQRLLEVEWPPAGERVAARARRADGAVHSLDVVARPLPRRPGAYACWLHEPGPAEPPGTRRTREAVDSTPDGMLAVGPDGEAEDHNAGLLRLWRLPAGAAAGPAEALFGRLRAGLRAPRHPLFDPGALLADARVEVADTVELTDGRVLQVSCRWAGGAPGTRRIWWFRDVTPWHRAEAELTERNRRIALGDEVGAAVVAGGPLRAVLQRCAQAMLTHLDGAFARVWLLHPGEDVLTLEASAGLHTGLHGRFSRIPVGHAKIGRIARSRLPHLTNDLLDDPLLADAAWARRTGMTAFAGYPMVFEGRLVGVMAMFADRPLSPTVLEALRGCAERLATAVARAWSEAEVRESERRFRLLAEAALEGIVIHEGGVLVDANPGFARLLGYDAAALPGRRLADFLELSPAADGADPLGWHEQPRELMGRHRDGSGIPLEVSARAISRGGRALWVVVIRDLRERKHLEEHRQQLASERVALTRAGFLARASRLLGASLESGAVHEATARLAVSGLAELAVVLTLEDGRVSGALPAHADPGAEAALRAAAEGLVGRPGTGAAEDGGTARDALLAALRRRLPAEVEPGALACLPLTASDTTVGLLVLGAAGPGRELDAATLGLAEELAYRAGSALENARLFGAAVQATRARDTLLGIVAHDLRNPLTVIAGAAELIADGIFAGSPDGEQRQLQMIRRAAGQMERLIADLLDAHRIDAGSLDVRPRAESPAALVAEGINFMGPLAHAAGLRLSAAVDEDLPDVWTDPGRVQQVLSNLVGTAIKFTPRGGSIVLSAVRDGGDVRIGVADTGPGIPPAQLGSVFDRFWQGDARDRRGVGLGLSIARNLVEAHGGRIWAESEPGAGTTFFFTLPPAPAGAARPA